MLRFATVGTSWITQEYIRGALDTGLWQLKAVYSRDRAKGATFAAPYGTDLIFTDLEELAKSPAVDAVYVASPNALHFSQGKLFLENGKHVICEKPVCAQSAKVDILQRIAQEHGVIFLEAIMFLHQPQLAILKDALQKIGNISLARIDFCQRSSKLDAFLAGKEIPNIFNPAMEAGALMDLGVYCVYPALALFGKPDRFSVETQRLSTGIDGADIVTLHYPDKLVLLMCSKLGQAGANTDFQGTQGTVAVESISRLANITLLKRDGPVLDLYGSDEKSVLMGREAADFYRYITQPAESAEEYAQCSRLSLETAVLLEQIRHAAGICFPGDQN